MPFPETQRVIYKINPLRQVICQLRFPAILKIDVGSPADFQDIIRKEFPYLEENNSQDSLAIPNEIRKQIPNDFLNAIGGNANRRFIFRSHDKHWATTLTRDFIALETNKYTSWEEFREKLILVTEALLKTYEPSFYTRIGLRYVNVIDRDELNLNTTNWQNLIADFILGELSILELQTRVKEKTTITLINLDSDDEFVRVRHGLVNSESQSAVSYLIDNDFHTVNETGVSNAFNKLDDFNALNRRLFRWCIKDDLHDALRPQ